MHGRAAAPVNDGRSAAPIASRRNRPDLVTFAHITEHSGLRLKGFGCPRVTEKLMKIGLDVDNSGT